MKYIVISRSRLHELIKLVNTHIKEGYLVQGGLCCMRTHNESNCFQYNQAMVKHEH